MLNFIEHNMRILFKYSFVLTCLAIALYSCVKKKTYTTSPEIEFKNFYKVSQEVYEMTFTYKDGDGDIGKDQEDQTSNLSVTYHYFDNDSSKFCTISVNKDTSTHYTIRKTESFAMGKPVLADVTILLNPYRHADYAKRVKYTIFMTDNAGNKSNVITTPEIVTP
jgi:hypothetical protein